MYCWHYSFRYTHTHTSIWPMKVFTSVFESFPCCEPKLIIRCERKRALPVECISFVPSWLECIYYYWDWSNLSSLILVHLINCSGINTMQNTTHKFLKHQNATFDTVTHSKSCEDSSQLPYHRGAKHPKGHRCESDMQSFPSPTPSLSLFLTSRLSSLSNITRA